MAISRSGSLKIIPLGGVGEIGKNLTVIEYGKDIVIIDCGVMFPDEDMLGIDLVIPDTTYLEDNKDRIKAILLTHGHEDHIGALPYVLKWLDDVPVYGTKLTLGLVELRLKEHGMKLGTRGNVISPGDKISAGCMSVEFIHVSHSIAGVVALAIKTPIGVIVHTADFKVDQTPIDGQVMDLRRFAELGEKGVLVMMSDSTNVERPGYTLSERVVGELFSETFNEASGRILVATFASHLARIQQILDAAISANRQVAIVGRSMENNVKLGIELGYLRTEPGLIVDIDEIASLPDENVVIITTGSQGEPMSALTRMSLSEYRRVTIRPGDTVIISASPIPGNERMIGRTINRLFKQGAEVIYEAFSGVHVSGHASQEELKLMLNLVKPKYFIPVHGEYRHLIKHARLAEDVGIPASNIVIPDLGAMIQFDKNKGVKVSGKVRSGRVFVDGVSVGDIGDIVLKDRRLLAQDGIVLATVVINSKTGQILKEPDIFTRGFIYVRESGELIEDICNMILNKTENLLRADNFDEVYAKDVLKDSISSFLYQKTGRRPMVIPVILDV